ncbi:MAG TPA: hypothetical protein V6D14_01825 [Coleofasciculaceae cyanobacterium]
MWFRVHPIARDGDLETQIIVWGEGRRREVEPGHGVQVKLRSGDRAKVQGLFYGKFAQLANN